MNLHALGRRFSSELVPLRRRWWLPIIGGFTAAIAAVVLVAMQTPGYRAQARVAVAVDQDASAAVVQRAVTSAQTSLRSPQVARAADDLVGPRDVLPPRRATIVGQSGGLAITVVARDPDSAARAADAYALAWIEVTRRSAVDALEADRQPLAKQRAAVVDRIADLEAAGDDGSDADREELTSSLARLDELDQRLAAIDVEIGVQRGDGTLTRSAAVDVTRVSQRAGARVAVAGLGGVVAGAIAAMLLRPRRRAAPVLASDIADRLQLPTLAVLPWAEPIDARPLAMSRPTDPFVEQVRALRVAVQFAATSDPTSVVLIAGAAAGDGKSTVAANLAVVAARGGRQVLLIDADLRQPHLAGMFGLGDQIGLRDVQAPTGLAEVLAGGAPDAALEPISERLWLVRADRSTDHVPTDLLASDRFGLLLQHWRRSFDLIVIDTAPVLAVGDAAAIAARADAVVLVVRADRDPASAVDAAARLRSIRCQLLGLVLNGVDPADAAQRYGHGYGVENH